MRIVSYIRVSTKSQGTSGLGLEAQQEAVETFAKHHGGTIVAEYREVETGKRKDRPELARALAHARRSKATLVVAKLDRLARSVAFTSALMESKVDFVCCDNPHANKLTIHIFAAVAEHEAEAISQGTKAALAAARARGVKLGSARPGHWDDREHRRLAGTKAAAKAAGLAHAQAANEAYVDLFPIVRKLRGRGLTLQEIAERLNGMGHTTRREKSWTATQVRRLLRRGQEVAQTV